MSIPRKPATAIAAALAAGLLLSACSSGGTDASPGSSPESAGTLIVGDVGGWLEGHLDAAGLLDDIGYEVEFKDLAGASVYATLSAGQIDAGVWGFDANGAKTIADGSDARIVGLIGPEHGADPRQGNINIFVSQESGIESTADLAGKTIGVNWGQGTTADVILHAALAEANLTPADLDVKYFTDATGASAFLSRQLDGFVTSYNGAFVEDMQNNGTSIVYYANEASAVAYVIASREPVIEDPAKKELLADFVTRVTKYYDWRGEDANLDAFTAAVEQQQSTTPELAREVALGIGKTVQVLPYTDENVAAYQQDLDNLLAWGLLDQEISAEQLINRTFADAIDAARD